MKRIVAVVLSFVLVILPFSQVSAQSSRYRMQTQAGAQDPGSAPSFRGGNQGGVPGPNGVGQGVGAGVLMQMPSSGTAGAASGAGGTTIGDAAMISMGYQVHILGEVIQPGTYRVAASERLSEVIRRAGGLTVNGSERNIELRRKGGGVQHVDLLGYSLLGKLQDNPYLTDNDVVFVPLRSKVVQVVGAVKRPETYELTSEKSLEDVMELSGGFNAATSVDEPIRVIRFKDGKKSVDEVPIDEKNMKDFVVQNGDVIVVPNLVTKETSFDYNVASIPGDQVFYPSYEDRVFVLGGVAFPGAYPFSPYYMVNQYISLAGGLNDRGKEKYRVTTISGKSRRAKPNDRVNPGDTIMIGQRWMSPAGWAAFALSIASFGLSASSTIIALQR
ncbi:MAG: SLBB domain-containing protein [Pseudomonadota bacterium]